MPLDDHLKLTQYLATVGKKRKKREAEAEAVPKAETIPDDLDDYRGRFFNISSTGLGTVNYDWTSVADQYLKLGAATALLFGLAGMIPSPAEPVLPVTLKYSNNQAKVATDNEELEDFIGPYDIGIIRGCSSGPWLFQMF